MESTRKVADAASLRSIGDIGKFGGIGGDVGTDCPLNGLENVGFCDLEASGYSRFISAGAGLAVNFCSISNFGRIFNFGSLLMAALMIMVRWRWNRERWFCGEFFGIF